MFFILYKTTNLINSKYYYGVHKTRNLDDGYLGSGKYLSAAIQKYGKENFTREILEFFSSKEEMFEKEKEIIDESIVRDKMSYNVKIGGSANFYFTNENKLNHKNNQHLIHVMKLKTDKNYAQKFSEKMKKVRNSLKHVDNKSWNRNLSKENSILVQNNARKIKEAYNKNYPYGFVWMNDNDKNYKISWLEMSIYLQQGFLLGLVKNSRL